MAHGIYSLKSVKLKVDARAARDGARDGLNTSGFYGAGTHQDQKFAEAQADSADAGYEKAPGPRKIGVGLETIKQLQAILEKLGLLPAPTPGLLGGFLIIQSSII